MTKLAAVGNASMQRRQRIFAPAATAAGLDHFRPYDLRHSFVSLLFAEGRTFKELEGAERRPAEDVIREARSRRVPSEFPQRATAAARRARGTRKVAANRRKPSDGLEPSTPSLPSSNEAGTEARPGSRGHESRAR